MQNILTRLDGKRTHLVAASIFVFNALWIAGVIEPDPRHVEAVNYLLAAAGLTTLRLGVKKAQKVAEASEAVATRAVGKITKKKVK